MNPLKPTPAPRLWQVTLVSACAGGLGWGIRGQYGHETGAMIAGLLVSLVLVLAFRPFASSLSAARAVAFCTAAIGFGGAMTYGQTIGLTQNEAVVGNWPALTWGMLGLGLKGAIWIGFAGAFLGMGLSGVHYQAREMAVIVGGLLLLTIAGIWALNQPYDPAHRVLPQIYFSSNWHWYPAAGPELKPRREIWGGLLFALIGLVLYTGWFRRDHLARNMALWGCLGGLGFPIGQSLQAWHAWNVHLLKTGTLLKLEPIINWWNFMETTFGFVMGAVLAIGLWRNRHRIDDLWQAGITTFRPITEFFLFAVQVGLLCQWEFGSVRVLDSVGDFGIPRSLIPLIAVAGGRYWPYFMALPIVALPILGKTWAAVGLGSDNLPAAFGMTAVVMVVLTIVACRFASGSHLPAREFLGPTLVLAVSLYFSLNYVFLKFPWPWAEWTNRTPNALVYTVFAAVVVWAAVRDFGAQRAQKPQ